MPRNGRFEVNIGPRIRQLRAGRPQAELAAAIGMTQSQWSQIERGKSANPTLGVAAQIADALGVSLAELVDPEHVGRRRDAAE